MTSASGASYSTLLPVENFPRKDVKLLYTLAYSIEGKPLNFRGHDIPAKPEDFEFAKKVWGLTEKLLAEGKLTLFPTARKGGLQGVFEGLDELRQGKISAQKLVYKI